MRFWKILVAALGLAATLTAHAGGKREGDLSVSFHLEAQTGSENPKLVFPQMVGGQQREFRRIPMVGTKDIAAFNPFPSRDGAGYGVVIKLKRGAINRANAETAVNINRWLLAMVNGRAVDAVLIDQAITDGTLVIWKGVGLSEINALDKEIPRVGEKKPRG